MEDPAGFLLQRAYGFSPPEGLYCVIPAKAGIQNFKAEGLYGVTAAKAGIQNCKAFDKPGLLPRAGMARGAIRLKCYLISFLCLNRKGRCHEAAREDDG